MVAAISNSSSYFLPSDFSTKSMAETSRLAKKNLNGENNIQKNEGPVALMGGSFFSMSENGTAIYKRPTFSPESTLSQAFESTLSQAIYSNLGVLTNK